MKFYQLLISLLIASAITCPIYSQGTENSIHVISFNIRYDNPADGPNSWQFRKNGIAKLIRFHDADICGLQEALRNQIADLNSLLPEYAWIGVGREDGQNKGEFCPVFFRKDRFDVLDHGTFWLSETPSETGSKGWDAALPRIVTWCILRDTISHNEIRFYNTHFDHMGIKARAMSARLLVEKTGKYIDTAPLVITGDFNCIDSSIVHAVFRENGFRDAYNVSEVFRYGPNSTWNGFKEIENNQRIDFIYVNKNVNVRKHAILTDRWDNRFLSDHLPVIAEIVIPLNEK